MTKVLSIPSGKYYDQLTEFKLYVCPQTHKVRDAINKNVSGLLTFRADGGYMERVYKIDGSPLLIKDMNDDILSSLSEAQKNRVFTYLKKSHREQDTELSIYFLNEVEDLPNAPFVKAKDNSGIQNSCYCLLEDLRKGGYIYTTKQQEKLQPNYWWLLANPNVDEDHWNFVDSVRIGEESSYDAKKANGSYKSNFSKVRQGDIVFGYNSGTQNSVVAILKITRETDNRLHFRKELELEKPVSIDTISSDPITKQIDYLTTKCRQKPTLSKITQEQYHALMKLINIENVVQSAKSKNNSIMNSKQPLNQILYGPPGTGKTYNTIYKALDILEPLEDGKSWSENDSKEERKEALDRFNKLKGEGRIVMTTFHQSMSYEDFVEGIKPQTDDTISELTYTVEKGIFMRICENAYENYRLSISPKGTAEKEYSIEEKIDQFISEAIENKTEFETKNGSKFYIVDIDEYIVQIIVPANEKNADVKVRIKDLKVLLTELPVQTIGEIPPKFGRKKKQQYDSYLFVLTSLIRDSFKEVNTDKEDLTEKCIEEQNYVLIVDEINRGNVANIFGELITLIEEDKRIGNKEELRVKLPYSPKREFGVPRNLYIIGTMNTADRSVEALDSALRRRFSFTEMMPKPELLKYNGKYVEIKDTEHTLANLLYTINKRIEVLKDREHQIGHSYFIQFCKKTSVEPKELKDVFYNKIIPLLQEYFYGDYEKIRMVLSPDFVVKEEKKVAGLFKNIDKEPNTNIDIEAPYQLKKIVITKEVIESMCLINQYKNGTTSSTTEQPNAQ